MQEYATYENKKLELKKYIGKLDSSCKNYFGPYNKYLYPRSNPYKSYADVDDFKDRVLGDKSEKDYINNKTCKFISYGDPEKDDKKRYYKDVQNRRECDFVSGKWDETSINRKNRIDDGVCWVTDEEKECGSRIKYPDMLRPYRSKFNEKMPKLIVDNAEYCAENKACRWEQQTAYTYDCVFNKDSVSDNSEPIVGELPENMPLEEFERFLEEWYLEKKHGRAPETGVLQGKGDRCNNIPEAEEEMSGSKLPPPPLEMPHYVNYRVLNPTLIKDSVVIKKAMKPEYFKKFKDDWKLRAQIGEEKYQKHVLKTGRDNLEFFYNRMDVFQFESDYSISAVAAAKAKDKMLPSIPQSVVNVVMKNVANKKSSKRGLLAWHSTGSGKTCTATGVMDAFWETGKQIIFASSIDAIASNPDFVFHKCAYNLFQRFKSEEFSGNSEAHSMALIAAAFKKRKIRYLSFAKLSNRVANCINYKKEHKLAKLPGLPGGAKEKKQKTHEEILAGDDYLDLNNCVLIIDEVHNLFKPLANQKKQHEFLEAQLIDPKLHPGLKVVILTATPGDNIPDVLKLLNIIRNSSSPEIKPFNIEKEDTINRFKQQIRGMVSYFDMSYDDTKFPKVIDSEPVKLPMSQTQFEKYVEAYKSLKAIQRDYVGLAKKNELGKYYEPVRKYGNSLFNFLKDMDLHDFSSKFPYVIENIEKFRNEKHYLYSAFYSRGGYGGHGVVALSKEMEKRGYVKLTIAEAKKLNKAGKLPPAGVKRFILVISTELGEDGEAGKSLHELLKIYNHSENSDGSLIHVMLASNKYNESIDLKSVSHIHMLEPFITMAAEKQAIGRAVRFCSFAQKSRSKGEWVVKVHRYMSDKPNLVSVDNAPLRKKIQDDIAEIEEAIVDANDKDAIKNAKKRIKDKQGEIARLEKLLVKQKASPSGLVVLKSELKDLENIMSSLEKNKDGVKDRITELKTRLKEKAKELKKLDAPPKAAADNIENIDEKIFKESRERFKELFTVYQCMRQMAIDCRLLKNFHESTAGQKIECV